MTRLGRFVRRPRDHQLRVVEAFVLLGVARAAVRFLPFDRLKPLLGSTSFTTEPSPTPAEIDTARAVRLAVMSASTVTPWESVCLPQAMAARWMLRRRGVASLLHIGATFSTRTELAAHAWLQCGNVTVPSPGDRRWGAIAVYR